MSARSVSRKRKTTEPPVEDGVQRFLLHDSTVRLLRSIAPRHPDAFNQALADFTVEEREAGRPVSAAKAIQIALELKDLLDLARIDFSYDGDAVIQRGSPEA